MLLGCVRGIGDFELSEGAEGGKVGDEGR